jgi:hypothetical protein
MDDRLSRPYWTNARRRINERWPELKRHIKVKLSQRQWLYYYDLSDISEAWEIPVEAMSYALAKYATESPTTTYYGSVYE